MAIDVTVKPTLIYEHNGALHIRKYDYGGYIYQFPQPKLSDE